MKRGRRASASSASTFTGSKTPAKIKGSILFHGHWVNLTPMSSIVKLDHWTETGYRYVYDYIKENLAAWTDEACSIQPH